MTRRIISGITDTDNWLYESVNKPVYAHYQVLFVPPEDVPELVRLYRLSYLELLGQPYSKRTQSCRMVWACEKYSGGEAFTMLGAYEDLCGLLGR